MRFFAIASLVFTAATSVFAGPVAGRDNGPTTAVGILSQLSQNVAPLAAQLKGLNGQSATPENIIPLATQIKGVLQGAHDQFTAAKAQPGNSLAGSSSASDVASPLGDVVSEVLDAVEEILVTLGEGLLLTVNEVLTELCELVYELLGDSDVVAGLFPLLENIVDSDGASLVALGLDRQYADLLGYPVSK